MYIQRLAENLVQKAFFIFEIFSFEVDAYMCVQKTFLALSPTALKFFSVVAYSVKKSLAFVAYSA
jgi:hypothetical protein